MGLRIQFIKMPVSESLIETTNKKTKKLLLKYRLMVEVEVFYKLENVPTGNSKICEMVCIIPGINVFASSKQDNFEFALNKVLAQIEIQLKKKKVKLSTIKL
jgi:ribosome-associated translation inhibitor RaiA